MVFNSLPFLFFFSAVFFLYWFVFAKNLRLQNLLLLISSYAFYAFWDWRFILLLLFASILNFVLGYYMGKTHSRAVRKRLLSIGLIISIGGLVYFKYANFFISSFIALLSRLNFHPDTHVVNIILPLGISFFTFRNMAYLLDINKGKIEPATDWLAYFNFVAFFPSLIAGPIDKAGLLMPQLQKKRVFKKDEAIDGLRQILWGIFKKAVIADNCAAITDPIFANHTAYPASTLVCVLFFYAIQIYADFSGYSDMAIGVARLLGFNITRNFDYPFFAQNISEFWRRWHMSLTAWLTEYVFTPLSIAFRDYGKAGIIAAILINFLVIGLWHGPNWTFVLFGLLHGCYYIPYILRGKNISKKKKADIHKTSLTDVLSMAGTFILVMLAFVLFRSDTVEQALDIYGQLISKTLFSTPIFERNNIVVYTLILICFFMTVEWVGRHRQHALANIGAKWPIAIRWPFYYALVVLIFLLATSKQQFIYFQF
jgi:alginate O-acetyltransferase complex protein AlgI